MFDHLSRCLPAGKIHKVKITENMVDRQSRNRSRIFSLTEAQLEDLEIVFGHTVCDYLFPLFPDRDIKLATTFRYPPDQVISDFNFHTENLTDHKIGDSEETMQQFEDWYANKNCDQMSLWLIAAFLSIAADASSDLFRNIGSSNEIDVSDLPEWLPLKPTQQKLLRCSFYILKKMDAVYLTESLDDDIEPFLRRLNVETRMQRKKISGLHLPKRLILDEKLTARIIKDNPVDMALYRFLKLKRRFDPIFS